SRKRGPFAGKAARFSKRSDARAQKRTRAGVRGKPDEVAFARIEEAEPGRRIFLRSRRVRKIADRLQAYHSRDSIAPLLAALRINETPHLFRLKVGRLFVHERDEAQRLAAWFSGEAPSQRQQCCHAAPVIIRARAAKNRIVVRADHEDLRRRSSNLDFDVMTCASAQLVANAARRKARAG